MVGVGGVCGADTSLPSEGKWSCKGTWQPSPAGGGFNSLWTWLPYKWVSYTVAPSPTPAGPWETHAKLGIYQYTSVPECDILSREGQAQQL